MCSPLWVELRYAVERGVSPERLAKALNVDINQIHKKVSLLEGICAEAVEIGLKAAVDRFGEPVRFQGHRAFLEETVKVAMEHGIALEPGSPMARDIYERAIAERGNQLGPSKDRSAAPYRAPEKKQEVGKGKGIGL